MEELGDFGDSILGLILEKVSDGGDRKSCSQVCKQWYKVEAFTRSSIHVKDPYYLHKILPRFPHLINLQVHKKFSDRQLELVAKTCSKLQHLRLSYNDSDNHLYQGLSSFGDGGVIAIAKACPSLTHVGLCNRNRVGDIGVVGLIIWCRNLVALDLEGCIKVTDQSLKTIGAAAGPWLHLLDLNGCYMITDSGLVALAKGSVARTLKTLSLSRCRRITDLGVSFLNKMDRLEELSLARCGPRITDVGGVAVSSIATLKRINFAYLDNVTDVTLVAVCKNCPDLVEYRL